MKTPSQSSPLDNLMVRARQYAEFCLRSSGRMSLTLLLVGTDGPMVLELDKMTGERDKNNFVNMARLACIAYNATACVIAMEAWETTIKPGEPLDLTVPPSQAIDRHEVVSLIGEDHKQRKHQSLGIVRNNNGSIAGLSESEIKTVDYGAEDNTGGRFTHIMPRKVPVTAIQALAKTMLEEAFIKTT